ncbi:MAG: hypothetical protein HOW73_02220 [Polyangiaceae bacterium]|nr:hypothetical protein [Polyangiaceae bacterium]
MRARSSRPWFGWLLAVVATVSCQSLPDTPVAPSTPFVGESVKLAGIENDPPESFVLLPGDVVRVRTVSVEPLDAPDLVVDDEGNVDVPLAGPVAVGGLSTSDASAKIEAAIARFDRFARVVVTITQAAGHVATITGAVEKPGAIQVRPNMRLAEVLALAGGPRTDGTSGELADLADLDGASIVRTGSALPVSLGEALRGKTHHNVRVRAGDVIYVPPARGRMITVLGEVGQPKAFAWHSGMRLTTAVALAGGIARSGDGGDVRVIRGKLSAPDVYRTNLNALFRGEGNDVELAPGDVVYVGADWFWTTTEVISRLVPALAMTSLATGVAK